VAGGAGGGPRRRPGWRGGRAERGGSDETGGTRRGGGEIADDGHVEILFKRVAGADDPQGGDGEREPEPLGAGGIGHAGVLPRPSAALNDCEAVLDPGADTRPGGGTVRGREVGQDEPGVLIAGLPAGDERAGQAALGRDKGRAGSTPGLPGRGHELPQPDPVLLARWTEGDRRVDAQEGVPAHAHDAADQPAGIEAAIRQDKDGALGWNRGT